MKIIDFKNKPDKTTPINRTNLNLLQKNVEDVFNGSEPMGSIVVDDVTCKNINSSSIENGAYNLSTGEKITATNSRRNATPIEVKASTTYIFSNNGSGVGMNVLEYNASLTFIKSTTISSGSSFTTSSSTKYINYFRGTENTDKIQIEEDSVVTDYVPHKGFNDNSAKTLNLSDYIANGITVVTNNVVKKNNRVVLEFSINGTFSANTSVLIATLPSEWIPKKQIYGTVTFHSGSQNLNAGYVTIGTTGNVNIKASVASNGCFGTFVYDI